MLCKIPYSLSGYAATKRKVWFSYLQSHSSSLPLVFCFACNQPSVREPQSFYIAIFCNVKHEYLRSRASRCLTLSSSLAFPGVLEIYRDARAFILDLASYPGIFQSDFTITQCGNYGNLPPLQKIFVKSIYSITL